MKGGDWVIVSLLLLALVAGRGLLAVSIPMCKEIGQWIDVGTLGAQCSGNNIVDIKCPVPAWTVNESSYDRCTVRYRDENPDGSPITAWTTIALEKGTSYKLCTAELSSTVESCRSQGYQIIGCLNGYRSFEAIPYSCIAQCDDGTIDYRYNCPEYRTTGTTIAPRPSPDTPISLLDNLISFFKKLLGLAIILPIIPP